MKKIVSTFALFLVLSFIVVLIPEIGILQAEPRTIVIPDDYASIQEAINNANKGDIIMVKAGTYYENVIVNKPLTIKSQNGPENTIVCTVNTETGKNVFEIAADDVEISGFTIENSFNRTIPGDPFDPASYVDGCGIYVETCKGTKINRNIVKNNFEGVVFADCSNILVSENQIPESIHEGVRIAYSSSVTISNNTITSNRNCGMVVFRCSTGSVSENQIVANGDGAVVSNSQGITVSNNNITNNAFHGLNLVGGQDHRIFGNTMRNNTNGIWLSGSTNNNIYQNTIQANYYGIALSGFSNNFIYHNSFINNSLQTHFSIGNPYSSWDNGYPSGGNYWSDYNGTDNDGDGIGDTPYVIDGNNRDNYPLIAPSSFTPALKYRLTVDSMPYGVTFTVDNVTVTAPWSEIYNENTSVTLTMPESRSFEGQNYRWYLWSDRNTNRTRTVTMNTNIALTAIFAPENTSLRISILSPENKTYATTDVPLEITVNRIFYRTTYSLDGEANKTIIGNTTLTGLSNGPHNIIIFIEDNPGNISSSGVIYFTVATASPTISILSPEKKTYDANNISLTFTLNETISWIAYSLDGQENMTISANTAITDLSDGSHSLIVYAKDAAGNTWSSETVYFNIKTRKTEPQQPEPPQSQQSSLSVSSSPMEYGHALVALAVASPIAVAGYLSLKHKKLEEAK